MKSAAAELLLVCDIAYLCVMKVATNIPVGYVSAGFFGGIALGRVILLWVNKKLGERTATFVYAIFAIGYNSLHELRCVCDLT